MTKYDGWCMMKYEHLLMTALVVMTALTLWLLVRDAETEVRIRQAVIDCHTKYEEEMTLRGYRPRWMLSEELVNGVLNDSQTTS
jgi:hypothetical protein